MTEQEMRKTIQEIIMDRKRRKHFHPNLRYTRIQKALNDIKLEWVYIHFLRTTMNYLSNRMDELAKMEASSLNRFISGLDDTKKKDILYSMFDDSWNAMMDRQDMYDLWNEQKNSR